MNTSPQDTPSEDDAPTPLDPLRFHQLLVAVDGSRSSELALSAAVVAAQRNNARLTIMSVAVDAARFGTAASYDPGLQESINTDTQKALDQAVARVPQDISVTKVFRHGKPGAEIVAEANAGDYDAVLVGARGLGHVTALIGSVSNYVMHHADITVFVAHAPRKSDSTATSTG
jgi:nucleotide-binding universal stress UspA family protein